PRACTFPCAPCSDGSLARQGSSRTPAPDRFAPAHPPDTDSLTHAASATPATGVEVLWSLAPGGPRTGCRLVGPPRPAWIVAGGVRRRHGRARRGRAARREPGRSARRCRRGLRPLAGAHADPPGDQRHPDYAYRLAVDPPAAKELRLFGLADWTVERFTSRRKLLFDRIYRATRLREKPLVWSLLLLAAANVAVFWSLADAAAGGRLDLGHLVAYAQ